MGSCIIIHIFFIWWMCCFCFFINCLSVFVFFFRPQTLIQHVGCVHNSRAKVNRFISNIDTCIFTRTSFQCSLFPPTNMDARRFCSADKLPILISYDLKMLDGQRKHFLFFLEDFTMYIKTVFCHGKKKTVNANRHCIQTSKLM